MQTVYMLNRLALLALAFSIKHHHYAQAQLNRGEIFVVYDDMMTPVSSISHQQQSSSIAMLLWGLTGCFSLGLACCEA